MLNTKNVVRPATWAKWAMLCAGVVTSQSCLAVATAKTPASACAAAPTLAQKVQKTLDVQEVQNVMGRHEYFHTASRHKDEWYAIWATKTAGVKWSENNAVYEGTDLVKKYYVDQQTRQLAEYHVALKKLRPDIKIDENTGFMGLLGEHTLTTPVVEVAADGKTAKGVWMSPGLITGPGDGKFVALWMWEKYAVDFIKEDGQWKIWHFAVYTDFGTPYEKSWVESSAELDTVDEGRRSREAAAADASDRPKPTKTGTFYKQYSATTTPVMVPQPPAPYCSFKDTFSY